jgi:hypothetical protein
MTNIDTSTEAIAAMAPYWAGHPCYELAQVLTAERDAAQLGRDIVIENHAHLRRDLDADRDRLAATCRDLIKAANDWEQKYLTAAAERDAAAADARVTGDAARAFEEECKRLAAENAKMREALTGVLEIEGWDTTHPRYVTARAALAGDTP